MIKNEIGEYCEYCNKFVGGFQYQMCCSGHEYGCMGLPVEPCVCSDECWQKLLNRYKKKKEEKTEDGYWL